MDVPKPIASTPEPPYYSVIFTSRRTDEEGDGYAAMADRMLELAAMQAGFLGVESVRDGEGVGVTVSYWRDLESIRRWHEVTEHQFAQALGRERWYEQFAVRIARVERAYGFDRASQ